MLLGFIVNFFWIVGRVGVSIVLVYMMRSGRRMIMNIVFFV